MIEPDHPALPIGMQCRLLSISRSSFYYEPQGESEMNLALMLLIDKQFSQRRGTRLAPTSVCRSKRRER